MDVDMFRWICMDEGVTPTYNNPHDEVLAKRQVRKTQCLCGFARFGEAENLTSYIKFTSIGAGKCAEAKKSHNLNAGMRS